MTHIMRLIRHLGQFISMLSMLLADGVRYVGLCLRSPTALAAENLFLRKQLALCRERSITPRRATPATRLTLVWLARWFDWRRALVIVQPATLIRWHRQGFRVFWRWTSRRGRPPIPPALRALIRHMACENPTWGQERIANELLLKLGLRVSPRTVRKYLPRRLDRGGSYRGSSQRWRTFIRNHAQAIVACDFCTVVTATFRLLYVFVVMEHATRRILHINTTAHPTACWTMHQLREAIPANHAYRFIIHDRETIFSRDLDQGVCHLGLRVLKTPPQSSSGECPLRAAPGHAAAGMPGLADPFDRAPFTASSTRVGAPLQQQSPAHGLGARDPTTTAAMAGAAANTPAPHSKLPAGRGASDSWRLAP
jgi:putative transposase